MPRLRLRLRPKSFVFFIRADALVVEVPRFICASAVLRVGAAIGDSIAGLERGAGITN
jgi:hypothetical protein